MDASTPPQRRSEKSEKALKRDVPTKPTQASKRIGPAPKRVSLWNIVYRRRICGNSAPMEHNLAKYLAKHPECEVFCGQDAHDQASSGPIKFTGGHTRPAIFAPPQKRVTLWHKVEKRKVVGNAAPLERNVAKYLAKHPEYEVYDANGHEREKDVQRAVEKVLSAIVTSVANQHRPTVLTGRSHGAEEESKPLKKRKNVSAAAGGRRWHISGGKRPNDDPGRPVGGASKRRATSSKARAEVKNHGASGIGVADTTKKFDGLIALAECQVGFSLLLHVAGHSCSPQLEVRSGTLDLLVKATHDKSCSKDIEVEAATPDSSEQPESPPFSPMTGPVDTVSAMEELCLSAPSPKTKTLPFHQLSAY